ncbi:NAD-dependent epimerase/dehydratase family protein, partial [Acinetobacter baumannii]
GASGWLGSALVEALLERGDAVVGTDLMVSPTIAAFAAGGANLTAVAADLGEWHQVMRLFEKHKPDAVIHAAAIVGVIQCADIPIKAQRVNVEG